MKPPRVVSKTLPDGSTVDVRVAKKHRLGPRAYVLVLADDQILVMCDGLLIAQRMPPAESAPKGAMGTWLSLEPGYKVFDGKDYSSIVIERRGVVVQ